MRPHLRHVIDATVERFSALGNRRELRNKKKIKHRDIHTNGNHLVFSTDPESVKDEFAFDNPGFRQDERQGWQHDAPTLPMGGKSQGLHVEFTRPDGQAVTKDDIYLEVGLCALTYQALKCDN
ncbi:hypothetical protein EVAR_67415_1 [Eumeta japonica]|uniref:Uncharacterized protein n=1 Tax=Eumeta variegata TaxID=151549 RepID=A0A4C2AAL8_EUMVA|nr:hypothetical protein EVAR_67415_1 [Eumeta japonica]